MSSMGAVGARLGLAGLLSLMLSIGTALACQADSVPDTTNKSSPASSRRLDAEIIEKELELLKLDTNLRLHMLPHPWSQRRWFAYSLNNCVLTATGAFMNGCGRFSYFHTDRIRRAPKYLFGNAALIRSFANMISCGGCLIEYGFDKVFDYRDHRRGVDLPTMHRYASGLQAELDSLLEQRLSLATSMPPDERSVFDQENALLRKMRDAELCDFTRFYAEAKGNRAAKGISLILTFASNFNAGTGALVGEHSTIGRSGSPRSRVRLGGAGGICDIVSSSVNIVNPLVQEAGAYAVRRLQRKRLSKLLHCREQVNLEELRDQLQQYQLTVSAQPNLQVHSEILKQAIFNKELEVLQRHEAMRTKSEKSHTKSVAENMVPTGLSGAGKLTNGIGTATGSFWYTAQAQKRFDAIGSGALVYGAGYSAAAAELLRHQFAVERSELRARKNGKSSRQVLDAQLQDLEKLSSDASKLKETSSASDAL